MWAPDIIVSKIKKFGILNGVNWKRQSVCFAKEHAWHASLELNTKNEIVFDKKSDGNFDGCPSYLCQITAVRIENW